MSADPTFRFDPFTGEHVLLSPGRATKPADDGDDLPSPPGPCPFCPGNEVRADEVAVFPAEGPWQVRALLNRYPAVRRDAADTAEGKGARGAHEVLVEGRAHDRDLAGQDASLRRLVLRAYRDRVAALEAGAGYVHLFRNRGRRAGSSQPHPHAQVLATEHVPEAVERRWRRAERFHTRHGQTLLASVIAREREIARRVLRVTPHFVALCPAAPRFNGETWIVPRGPGAFSRLDDPRLDALADLLGEVLPAVLSLVPPTRSPIRDTAERSGLRSHGGRRRNGSAISRRSPSEMGLEGQRKRGSSFRAGVLRRASYNLVWRQPPVAFRDHPAAFWTLEILPRGGAGAGYELSSESALVTLAPEEAAARLRGALGTA